MPNYRGHGGNDMLSKLHPAKLGRKSDEGASAVEYGLLVAAIAALIVVIVFALGGIIQNVFSDTCTEIGTGSGNAVDGCAAD